MCGAHRDACTHARQFAECMRSRCGHKHIFSPMLLENLCDSTHAVPAEQTCRTKKQMWGGGGVVLPKKP